jgi:hypothetical protein
LPGRGDLAGDSEAILRKERTLVIGRDPLLCLSARLIKGQVDDVARRLRVDMGRASGRHMHVGPSAVTADAKARSQTPVREQDIAAGHELECRQPRHRVRPGGTHPSGSGNVPTRA